MAVKKGSDSADSPDTNHSPKTKTRTAPFMTWAKEKRRIPSALGAAVALRLDKDADVSEATFDKYLEQYGNQKSFNV